MKNTTIYLSTLFVLLSFSTTLAQVEDLTKDTPFFKEQSKLYQRWLDHTGLGKVIKVYDVEVEADELSLFLAFHKEESNYVTNVWEQLKATFDRQNPLSLEQQLFYKMCHIMEIRHSVGNVQLYDTYNLKVEPCFFRGIYFDEKKVKVEESSCRSEIVDLNLRPPTLRSNDKNTVMEFQQILSKEVVYQKILQFAQKKYTQTECIDRYPEIKTLDTDEVLHFEVLDLCREVLIDEAQPTLCTILQTFGYDCNWVRREKLDFIIKYEPSSSGIKLNIEIDGKYGSGVYSRVRRGGYINMEIDFDEYLERYAKEFKEELKRFLLR